LLSTFFVSTSTGWAVSVGGKIINTTDGGSNWYIQSSGYSRLNSVYFTDASIGWIVGDNGTILNTTNAGNSWNTQNSGTSYTLTAVCFPNASTGYAVGDNGTILKYGDITGTNDKLLNLNNKVTVYPNPFTTSAILRINDNIQINDAILSVYDMHGKEVGNITNISSNKVELNRKGLNSGLYFYRLSEENNIFTGKFIIK